MRTTRLPPATSLLCLLCGCGSTPTPPPVAVEPLTIEAGDFPGAAALLRGLTTPVQRNEWRVGEAVLYALHLQKPGESHRWLARLTLADKEHRGPIVSYDIRQGGHEPLNYMSPTFGIDVEVFTASGEPVGRSRVRVAFDFLRYDWVEACEDARAAAPDLWQRQRIGGAHAGLVSFLQILQQDPLLSGLLWQVIDRPSLWSVATSFGVTLGLDTELEHHETVGAPLPAPWRLPAVRFPLTVTANGTPMLHATLVATSPWVPLRLGAGIVGLTAHRPSDPGVRFAARLLAAASP